MIFRALVTCALLAFQAPNIIASPIVASANDELVRIPGGLMQKSNVHRVPEGGKVIHTATEVQLISADGTILHTSPLTGSKPIFNRRNGPGTSPITARTLQSAVIKAQAQVSSISGFTSIWDFPPLPLVNSGQLLMYFSAIAPPSGDALLLPALQYGVSGAGGGPFWGLASWLITSTESFVTNLTEVIFEDGGTLPSFIINEDQLFGTATTHVWFCGFTNFEAQTALTIQTSEEFNVIFEALEITGALSLSNLPNEATGVGQIVLLTEDDSESVGQIPWVLTSDAPDGITINNASVLEIDALEIMYRGELPHT